MANNKDLDLPDLEERIRAQLSKEDTGWTAPPMIPGDWKDIPDSHAVRLLTEYSMTELSLDLPLTVMGFRFTGLRAMPLDFYPGWLLCEAGIKMSDQTQHQGLLAFLYGDDGILPLLGNSDVVFHANDEAPLSINTEDQALQYLKFFCSAIRDDYDSRFRVVETPEDITWHPDATKSESKKIESQIQPLSMMNEVEDGRIYSACILHADHIFESIMRLGNDGSVDMLDDKIIGSDLNILPEKYDMAIRAPMLGPTPGDG